jgi:mono/diheme cytochrome c family protein
MMPLVMAGVLAGCSRDMQDQASYQGQEAPRLQSPHGSIPQKSRSLRPIATETGQTASETGARLFKINCVHCHGLQGEGDGPVASFLKERPANLHSDEVRTMSVETIYRVVTDGKDMMPSFQGELSAEERIEVARFVAALPRPSIAHHRAEKEQ